MLRGRSLSLHLAGKALLDQIDLSIEPGQILGVVGPNGAGKTSLLRVLAGETQPTAGQVEIDGKALSAFSPTALARRRAVLPQSESLRFAFSVRQVLELGRHPWLGKGSDDEEAVEQVLGLMGLDALADRTYPQLSGGEKARVQFARVLAQLWPVTPDPPSYLLLDEPTASLDLAVETELLSLLRRLADRGLAILVILHDLNQALAICDQVLILKQGRQLSCGPAREALSATNIERAFGLQVELLPRGEHRPAWIVPVAAAASAGQSEIGR